MERFLDRHAERIVGVLCGLDRVLFRGSLLMICHLRGMKKFLVQGFRNHDIRRALYPGDESRDDTCRKASNRVTRLLRLLRAHGLVPKVSHTLYYRVTHRGQHIITTALRLREIDVALLAA